MLIAVACTYVIICCFSGVANINAPPARLNDSNQALH